VRLDAAATQLGFDTAATPVAVLVDSYPRLSESFVRNEVAALARLGHPVRVEATRHGERLESAVPVAWRADDTQARRWADCLWLLTRHPWRCLHDLCQRRRWRREETPARLRELAPIARRVSRFRAAHLHAHFAASAALDTQRIATMLGLRHSVTAHAYDIFRSPANLPEKLQRATFATTGCEYNRRHLRQLAPQARVELVVMGVDAATFRRYRPHPGGRTAIAVGRLVEKKGFERLLRATALIDDMRVWIVGDGELRDALEQLADELLLGDRVEFLGAREDVRSLMEQADVLAMPFVIARDGDRESMPVVLKEAMAMELPVIATDVAGVSEAVHPPWGALVPAGDTVAFATALRTMLELPPQRRAELGHAAREWVLEHASLERETARLSQLIGGSSYPRDRMTEGDELPIEGRVEQVHEGVLEGWAWSPEAAGERVQLRVSLDGKELGRTVAELPRPTLAEAGVGDGSHGFRFVLPDDAAQPGRNLLRVDAGKYAMPPAAGFSVSTERDDSQWKGVRFSIDHPDAPVAGEPAIEGRVEQVRDGVLEGWAWSPSWPSERLQVRIILDDEEVGTAIAELPRPSLATAGIGDGAHAFRFELPTASAHPGSRTLCIDAAGAWLAPASRFVVESGRSDDPWYGARFTIGPLEATAREQSGNGVVHAQDLRGVGETPDAAPAVAGLDGWLFDGAALQAAGAQDTLAHVEARVASLLDALDQLDGRVAQTGVKLLPVLVPTKELLYRDQLPAAAATAVASRPGELVARGLADHKTLDVLDLLPALHAGAEQRHVFSPTFAKLSEWGSFYAYRAVIKRVAMILPGIPPPVELDASMVLTAPARRWQGPVAVATDAGLVQCLPEELPEPPNEPVVMAPAGAAERTPREHLARLGASFALGWEQSRNRDLGRVLFVGGPEHEALVEWAARHFRFTILIGADSPVIDLVALERPDLIVYLVEERSLLTPA
jgi:colanic acid/amylovoran biosynthesis glycosyltransferase